MPDKQDNQGGIVQDGTTERVEEKPLNKPEKNVINKTKPEVPRESNNSSPSNIQETSKKSSEITTIESQILKELEQQILKELEQQRQLIKDELRSIAQAQTNAKNQANAQAQINIQDQISAKAQANAKEQKQITAKNAIDEAKQQEQYKQRLVEWVMANVQSRVQLITAQARIASELAHLPPEKLAELINSKEGIVKNFANQIVEEVMAEERKKATEQQEAAELARKEAELDRKMKEFDDYHAQLKQEFNSYVQEADALLAQGEILIEKVKKEKIAPEEAHEFLNQCTVVHEKGEKLVNGLTKRQDILKEDRKNLNREKQEIEVDLVKKEQELKNECLTEQDRKKITSEQLTRRKYKTKIEKNLDRNKQQEEEITEELQIAIEKNKRVEDYRETLFEYIQEKKIAQESNYLEYYKHNTNGEDKKWTPVEAIMSKAQEPQKNVPLENKELEEQRQNTSTIPRKMIKTSQSKILPDIITPSSTPTNPNQNKVRPSSAQWEFQK